MNSPFVYGKIASNNSFTDREKDCASLVQDFKNLTNVTIISPRRWGKSSLVRRVGEEALRQDKRLRICYLDIFNVRDENEFYEKLAAAVIKGTSSKIEEIMGTALKYASALIPSLTAGDPATKVSLEFKLKELSKSADEILDLAEKIAKDKKIRIVICIDEFQQISRFKSTDAFQSKLRSHWQLHSHVSYCLYGSRRHMMMDVFTNTEKPFYKFGKIVFLEKIDSEKWPPFITGNFSKSGKSISVDICREIVSLVDNNPYYIQQLSEEVWNRTEQNADTEILSEGFQAIVRSQSGLNLALTQTLKSSEINLLHAIVMGEHNLSSAEVIRKYNLKSSLNVQRAKKALAAMDIIDIFGKSVEMEDPIYAYWLKNIYFGA